MKTEPTKPRLGIALGGGAARGWAHIGVLRALAERGMEADVVSGTSIGALVGGIYAAGRLGEFEEWVVQLTRREVFSLLDFAVSSGGTLSGKRLMELGREHLGDIAIEDLPRRYAAVATDLNRGSEVWLKEGALLTAIRASISLPGIFTPTRVDTRWLVDGGLVNPVPVTVARALGADFVIGVDLSYGRMDPTYRPSSVDLQSDDADESKAWWDQIRGEAGDDRERTPESETPSLNRVLTRSLNVMQDRIGRSRLAGDPPNLLITPRVSHVPSFDFTRGQSSIQEGYDAVQRALPALCDLLGHAHPDCRQVPL